MAAAEQTTDSMTSAFEETDLTVPGLESNSESPVPVEDKPTQNDVSEPEPETEPTQNDVSEAESEGSESEEESEGSESDSDDESSEDLETGLSKYNSPDTHDEVECLLEGSDNGSNALCMELIATDPKYYLDLVQHYTHTRDGREIYLPDLLNILIRRVNGRLTIKFKMSDNTQWYEVGYTGGDFDDDAVYAKFAEKVNEIIRNPPPSKRSQIEDTLRPGVKDTSPPPMINQGNQYKISKIDRFLGRTGPTAAPPNVAAQFTPETLSEQPTETSSVRPEPESQPQPQPQPERTKEDERVGRSVQFADELHEVHGSSDQVDQVLRSYYRDALSKKLAAEPNEQSLLSRMRRLRSECPNYQVTEFNRLVSLLSDETPFVSGLVACLDGATASQRVLILDYLKSVTSARSYSHQQLVELLNLKQEDADLLKSYNINLPDLV